MDAPVQKHILIAREIIFVVPPVPPGPESWGKAIFIVPPGPKSGGAMSPTPSGCAAHVLDTPLVDLEIDRVERIDSTRLKIDRLDRLASHCL